jgi:putative DNA primase/helicase
MDFNKIKAVALSNIESVLANYCPGGKRQGREYLPLNKLRADSKIGSFSINLDTGAWSDFATDARGGDLIALVAYIEGIKQGEAAKRLSQFLGLSTEKNEA